MVRDANVSTDYYDYVGMLTLLCTTRMKDKRSSSLSTSVLDLLTKKVNF